MCVPTLAEQEYFLVDKNLAALRPDLLLAGHLVDCYLA